MRIALLCLMLAGCGWHYPAVHTCTFGGATPEEDAICAERNFGAEGAAYIRERQKQCPLCERAGGPDAQYCALNCWSDE